MTTQQIHEIALQQGIVQQALATVTDRVRSHFGDGTPTPAAAALYIAALPVWDKVGMAQQAFLAMPGPWRIDQARRFEPPPAPRRKETRSLTTEELAELDAKNLPRHERTEEGRRMQQTPAP